MSLLYFTKNIDFRLYIGHAVAFICLSAYGLIFYFIWKDGAWGREMKRRERLHYEKVNMQNQVNAMQDIMKTRKSASATTVVQKNPVAKKKEEEKKQKKRKSKKKKEIKED
jgi:hypothetical protein|tara:strand:+ start:202 stop:534 length:333 start_codon:yes stop_codon:yes gene_type:complete